MFTQLSVSETSIQSEECAGRSPETCVITGGLAIVFEHSVVKKGKSFPREDLCVDRTFSSYSVTGLLGSRPVTLCSTQRTPRHGPIPGRPR